MKNLYICFLLGLALVSCGNETEESQTPAQIYLTKDIVSRSKDIVLSSTSGSLTSITSVQAKAQNIQAKLQQARTSANSCMQGLEGADIDKDGIPDFSEVSFSNCIEKNSNGEEMTYSGKITIKDLSLTSTELAAEFTSKYQITFTGNVSKKRQYSYAQSLKIEPSETQTNKFTFSENSQMSDQRKTITNLSGTLIKASGFSLSLGGIFEIKDLAGNSVITDGNSKFDLKVSKEQSRLYVDPANKKFEGEVELDDGKNLVRTISKFSNTLDIFFNGERI